MQNILKKRFLFLFLFFSILLLCSFFRLKELFQVKNDLTTSLLFFSFFFQNAKNLGRSDDAKRRKKEDGLIKQQQIPPLHRELVKAVKSSVKKEVRAYSYGQSRWRNMIAPA